ncbi:unnamed protein product [Auanema sp. JU1783]|nr:unnamed protein product [Auanema sp. JU1783]
MGFIPARCAICTSAFHSGNISCLPCGHTFHYACVVQWIQQSKTCPQCRCLVIEKNVIKQIYFDLIEFDKHDKTSADDYAQKCEELSIELEKEKGSKYELNQKIKELQKNCDNLTDLLGREKKKLERKLPGLESRNRELEMRCRDYDFVQEELRKAKSRLAAAEFYQLLAKGSVSDAEAAVDRYVDKNGDPSSSQFINLLKRQLQENRNANTKLQQSIRAYEKDHEIKNKKLAYYKKLCQELKAEMDEMRCAHNVNTPYNPRLKRVFDKQPRERRPSLGFDESIVIPDDVIDSAFKSKPVMGKIRNANEEQQDSFNFEYQGDMDKALPFPSLDETLDTSADFSLPKNVLNRISAGASLRQTNPLGIVPKGAQRSLEMLKNREDSGFAPRPVKKPVKRKFEPTNPGNSFSFFRNFSNGKSA